MTLNLTQRFINGLQKYNLTPEEIEKCKYRHIGGDSDGHYLKLIKRLGRVEADMFIIRMGKETKCVCGHDIVVNCYIQEPKNKHVLVLGSCCIKKFVPNGLKSSCTMCNEPHKNRKNNFCNDCRFKYCPLCQYEKNNHFETCYKCYVRS